MDFSYVFKETLLECIYEDGPKIPWTGPITFKVSSPILLIKIEEFFTLVGTKESLTRGRCTLQLCYPLTYKNLVKHI